ncbi:serine racemase VanT catalytic subunit [Paenibacillus gansuensis]|uniref:Alanine racemase n=1 Tax=Paenibacillus gansuensis TaxID=306542 RepID=A0ABW5PHV3_9BACL
MTKERYGGIDLFKFFAAILVITIHTGPLLSYNSRADFLLTSLAARIAVPFFFMASGYFFFHKIKNEQGNQTKLLRQFLQRTGILYAICILIYLPVNAYAGHLTGAWNLPILIKSLLFGGTFYHLWYLPALMIGVAIVYGLRSFLREPYVIIVTLLLYLAALLGDNYYSLAAENQALQNMVQHVYGIMDSTRNGIFFAPLFIALGSLEANRRKPKRSALHSYILLFGISMAVLFLEGLLLQRSFAGTAIAPFNDMYAALVPAVFFLFLILLAGRGREHKWPRRLSTWIYVLHPAVIVGVRGIAKLTGLEAILIEDSLVHFASVVILSVAVSLLGIKILDVYKKERTSPLPRGKERAWAEISIANLLHNVRQLQSLLPRSTALTAVVKANAYGHGSVEIAKELQKADIHSFAVASVDEGVALRRSGLKGEILILGFTPTHRLDDVRRYKLVQTVVSAADAERLQEFGKPLRVHIKIDTGLHRLGEPYSNTEGILSMYRHSRLHVAGTFSHLAAADSLEADDLAFTRLQFERFQHTVSQIRAAGLKTGRLHLLNSSGILNYYDAGMQLDGVRSGIALYGLLSKETDRVRADIDLRPVMSLKANVTRVQRIHAGEPAGYNRSFLAERDTSIATLSIGYADGIPRELPEKGGSVLIRGRRARILATITMDQMLVDVTGIPGVQQGDTVTLLGRDGNDEITAGEIAEWTGTITNELLSTVGARVTRIYQ